MCEFDAEPIIFMVSFCKFALGSDVMSFCLLDLDGIQSSAGKRLVLIVERDHVLQEDY